MSTEKLIRITMFFNRRKGASEEDFNKYWAVNHGALITPWLVRSKIVKYVQYHTTPEYRKIASAMAATSRRQASDQYDGISDFYVRSLDDFENAFKDPEYLEKIRPDELKTADVDSTIITIGYDYVLIEDGKAVTTHERRV